MLHRLQLQDLYWFPVAAVHGMAVVVVVAHAVHGGFHAFSRVIFAHTHYFSICMSPMQCWWGELRRIPCRLHTHTHTHSEREKEIGDWSFCVPHSRCKKSVCKSCFRNDCCSKVIILNNIRIFSIGRSKFFPMCRWNYLERAEIVS